jgi:hypothetical protein
MEPPPAHKSNGGRAVVLRLSTPEPPAHLQIGSKAIEIRLISAIYCWSSLKQGQSGIRVIEVSVKLERPRTQMAAGRASCGYRRQLSG